jgi:hypothetical protein
MILLNPLNDTALRDWAILSDRPVDQTPEHLKTTHFEIQRIRRMENAKGKLEVRYLDFHFPYNMFGVNMNLPEKEAEGLMLLGFYAYSNAGVGSRPHMVLTRQDQPVGFEFYGKQFDLAWKIAKKIALAKILAKFP